MIYAHFVVWDCEVINEHKLDSALRNPRLKAITLEDKGLFYQRAYDHVVEGVLS